MFYTKRTTVYKSYTRAVWKVRGLTLLLRIGTMWRCGDGLFFEVPPPLASDVLLTTLHTLLENGLQPVDHLDISYLGAPFSRLEMPRNRMGRDLDCMADVLMGFHRSTFSKPNKEFNSDLAPCNFWAFRTMKMELAPWQENNGLQKVFEKWVERCKKCIACQWGISKKRPSPHLYKVQTRSNKVSPRTFQTTLVQFYWSVFLDGFSMYLLHLWHLWHAGYITGRRNILPI
jgi:hypothetical protein